MTKTELVKAVAETTEETQVKTGKLVEALIESLKEGLANGEDICLPGFGTFKVADRAARIGRNPATGEKLEIPATKRVSFKASKVLKAAVNE